MYLYSIFILLITPMLILLRAIRLRHRLSEMTGMTIVMALATSCGLTVGLMIGLNHQDQIFIVTVISMLVGLSIGVLCGMAMSLVAALNGLISGIMGGMMGAMLGTMIPTADATSASKIFIILYIAVMAIIFRTLPKVKVGKKTNTKK